MLKYLIEKEFKQIFRNPFLPKMIFIMPCMMMLVLPWAASMEIKNINLSVVDSDRSPYSDRLVRKAGASGYFQLTDVSDSYAQAMESVESGRADIILEIPADFEQELIKEGKADVLISSNAVNGTKGGLAASYLTTIVSDFAGEVRGEWSSGGEVSAPVVTVVPQNRFNPHLDYQRFMVPAFMVTLLTLLCGFLPALNIVGEKEAGTIEQINVTPVGKFTFIFAKLVPYWVVGFVVLTLCFVLAWLVYGVVPAGHFATIYACAVLFVLAVSGLGLIISNYSATMQQAMFVMYFFMIVLLLISGLFTPISSMPGWAQWITVFNPLKYFIQVMRMVYLKGSSLSDLTVQISALGGFALVLNLWAVLSYRKSS